MSDKHPSYPCGRYNCTGTMMIEEVGTALKRLEYTCNKCSHRVESLKFLIEGRTVHKVVKLPSGDHVIIFENGNVLSVGVGYGGEWWYEINDQEVF